MTEKILYQYRIDYAEGDSLEFVATHHQERGRFPREVILFYNGEELVAEVQKAYMKSWSKKPRE